MFDDNPPLLEVSYHDATKRLLETTAKKVGYVLSGTDISLPSEKEYREWIHKIDEKGRLLMNHILDWKVNRGIEETSEILGIKSVTELIEKHYGLQKSAHYVIRDLGAGDGSMIRELEEKLPQENIIIYGTGDYIYFDLYSYITKKTHFSNVLPDELIILFVEKVIQAFKKMEIPSMIERVLKSIEIVTFQKNDTIAKSSMTSHVTCMFENENVSSLSDDIQAHFEEYLPHLHSLKSFIIANFYQVFSTSFQKIFISKFNDLFIDDAVISKIDFQFSIRATSHVGGREYMKIISDYFYNSAKPGSIFLDNGVSQSYTYIPRLKELHDVALDLVGGKLRLIYDKKTNYFSSVIITKDIHYPDEFYQEFLSEGNIIVSLNEAYKSTFFRLEYFVRNFIISNFKNYIVFWDFHKQIVDTLKMIMIHLQKKDTSKIPVLMMMLINYIASHFKNGGTTYNSIDVNILYNYTIDGETLLDIIGKEIYTPAWMNIEANRKN